MLEQNKARITQAKIFCNKAIILINPTLLRHEVDWLRDEHDNIYRIGKCIKN